jgi:hypothetical protein
VVNLYHKIQLNQLNPFQPKPQGPVLPDRQMAAYGGIMGMDGRKQYGIGSWFQKAKDKVVDDLIPNEIKENPLLTAALVATGGNYITWRSPVKGFMDPVTDFLLIKRKLDTKVYITQEEKVTDIETGTEKNFKHNR